MAATIQQEQLLELVLQLKKTSPDAARQILNAQPQIAYALMPLMVAVNAVNFDVFQKILAAHAQQQQLQQQQQQQQAALAAASHSHGPPPMGYGHPQYAGTSNPQWNPPQQQSTPLPANANVNPVLVREKMPKSNVTGWGPRAGGSNPGSSTPTGYPTAPPSNPNPNAYPPYAGQSGYPPPPPQMGYGQQPGYVQPAAPAPSAAAPPYRNINMNTPTSKISVNAPPPPGFGRSNYGNGYNAPAVDPRNSNNNNTPSGNGYNNYGRNGKAPEGYNATPPAGPAGNPYNSNNGYAGSSQGGYDYNNGGGGGGGGYGAPPPPTQQPAPAASAAGGYSLPPGVAEMLAAMDESQRNMITSVLTLTPAQIALLSPEERAGIAQLRATLGIPPP